jgi:hypothetical protein
MRLQRTHLRSAILVSSAVGPALPLDVVEQSAIASRTVFARGGKMKSARAPSGAHARRDYACTLEN